MDRPRHVLAAAAAIFLIAILAGSQIDRRLMPSVEQHRFTVSVQLPPGTVLPATMDLTAQIESMLRQSPATEAVFSQIGLIEEDIRRVRSRVGVHMAEIHAFLKDGVSSREFMRQIFPRLHALDSEAITLQEPQTTIGEILGTTLSDIAVQIRGDDPDSAEVVMAAVRQKIEKIRGISQVFSSEEEKRPEIRLTIDRQRAAAQGILPREAADFVQQYMQGKIATDFKDFDRKIPILLRTDARHRQRLEDLLQTPILVANRGVPLSQVVQIEQRFAPAAIERANQVRQRTLFASITGRGYNSVVGDVEDMIKSVDLPEGFRIRLGGQRQEMVESFREMILAFVLAFVLVFLILAAQFESLLHPFTIILTVPLAVIGVVIGLLATGQSFNVMSLIGLVVLVGIVVNDAIIKVDFINQERRRGTDLRNAILLAGQKRLRPILMTTITTVLALLPMAIGFGEGAELRRPLAIAIIFGISFATMLTLVVVPVIYQGLERMRSRWTWSGARK